MTNTNIDSVAIRLNSLGDWAGSLKNLRPIVFFAEQGLQGALREASHGRDNQQSLRQNPPGLHNLERVIFIIDRSGSMEGPLVSGRDRPRGARSKFDYVREKISGITNSGYFPEDTQVSLVQFDEDHSSFECGVVKQGALVDLSSELAKPWCGTTTEFSKPLDAAVRILQGDRRQAFIQNPLEQRAGLRSLVFFLTDGIDQSHRDIAPIVRTLRDLNATTFVCGIGEDYNMKRIIEIASHAGAATWSHIPLEHGVPDVFDVQIPDLIRQLTSEEFYLKINATGDFSHLSAVTPSIRDVIDPKGQVFSGYGAAVAGLLLEKSSNIDLRLLAGRYASDKSPSTHDIPIVDINEAGAYYEQGRRAQEIMEKFLLVQALRARDIPLLRGMLSANSDLEPVIQPAIEEIERLNRENSIGSHSLHSVMSVAGYSDYNNVSQPSPSASKQGRDELFSGNLGPLDLSGSVGPLPSAKHYNPRAYDNVQPDLGRVPVLEQHVVGASQGASRQFPLGQLMDGAVYTLGRMSSSHCNETEIPLIVSADTRISRRHCQIGIKNGSYFIKDLGSLNGTYLNRVKIDANQEITLTPGDRIALGSALSFIFNVPTDTKEP